MRAVGEFESNHVIGVQSVKKFVVTGAYLVIGIAEHFFPAARKGLHSGVNIPVPHTLSRCFQDVPPGIRSASTWWLDPDSVVQRTLGKWGVILGHAKSRLRVLEVRNP